MENSLRPWKTSDVEFCLKVRNDPRLYRWFRQDAPISEDEQFNFIHRDITGQTGYNGLVIISDNQPIGLCSVRTTGEFSIAILPEFQGKGIAKWVMSQLGPCWSEVFIDNPALGFYLSKCGFKAISVKERAYYKKDIGLIDVILIDRK